MPTVPSTRVAPVTEMLHGEAIVDPYRWLEEESAATAAWTAAQNAYTAAFLDPLPGRAALRERLRALQAIGFVGGAKARGGKLFFVRRAGAQNQPTLCVREGDIERVILDPNERSADGTVALDWWYPSPDGSRVAYGLSSSGDERSTLAIREVATATDRPEQIPDARFASVAWLPDSGGLYYTRLPAAGTVPLGEENYNQRVYFHRIGTDPADNPVIFGEWRAPEEHFTVALSPNGRWLLITASEGWTKSELYLRDLHDPHGDFATVVAGRDALYSGQPLDDRLYLTTNEDAPNFRVFLLDPANPAREAWREIVPEGAAALQECRAIGERLALLYLRDATSDLRIADADGGDADRVALPGLGTVSTLDGEEDGTTAYFTYTSFFDPPGIWRCDLANGAIEAVALPGDTPDTADLITEQVWYTSVDGTRVPMFVIRRADLPRDGARPTLLTGYGGFNIALTPAFNAGFLDWARRGGIVAQPSLRGGSEYGESWHRAGMRGEKGRVFEDFIAAGERLIAAGWTRPERLGIRGGSNGGLLVGAALTQRPALFRAAVCQVPLLDMLRYQHFLIARLWIPEYGSADDPEGFGWLRAYSPYHRVVPGTSYPAVLLTAAASDSRVHPLHARKGAALLQAATSADPATQPILLRLETEAGHGAGKPQSKVLDESVDIWSFLGWQLGMADGA